MEYHFCAKQLLRYSLVSKQQFSGYVLWCDPGISLVESFILLMGGFVEIECVLYRLGVVFGRMNIAPALGSLLENLLGLEELIKGPARMEMLCVAYLWDDCGGFFPILVLVL